MSSIGAQVQNPFGKAEQTEADNRLPAMKMLVKGSILKGVMMPQYDESHRLSSVMRAEKLTMVNEDLINVETLRLEFFNPDRSPKGRIDLATATLEDQQILRSNEPVSLVSDELSLKGTGLVYELRKSCGFLRGPASASTLINTRTSMKSSKSFLNATASLTLVGAAAIANPLTEIPENEMRAIESLARPTEGSFNSAASKSANEISKDEEEGKQMNETLTKFLVKTEGLEDAAKTAAAASSIFDQVPPPPKDEASFKTATLKVTCDDGIYFDNSDHFVSFLKNVTVDYPGLKLTNADELKISFSGPPEAKESAKGSASGAKDESSNKIGVGEPKMLIATGAVVLDYKSEETGRQAKASARQVIYDFVKETVTLRGGSPWIISDEITGRITKADGYFRINAVTGDIQAVGSLEGIYENRERRDPYDSDSPDNPFTPENLEKTNFKSKINPDHPTVYIIGDSVSIGYTLPLREKLKKTHNVTRPLNKDGTPYNAGDTERILSNIDSWVKDAKPDIIVFNSGLWDIVSSDQNSPKTLGTSEEDYANNLRKIIEKLKESKARLIWATTTFVPNGAAMRSDSNVIKFNTIAAGIMKEAAIETVDLYTPSKEMPSSKRLGIRNIHLMGSGSAILADRIVKKVTDKSR